MRKQRPGHWIWIDHDAHRAAAKLGCVPLAVYSALCLLESETRGAEQKARFKATLNEIAEASGCSLATVKRMIPVLEEAGLVAVKNGTGLSQKTNRYTLLMGSHRASREAHTEPLEGLTQSPYRAHSEPTLTIQRTESNSSGPRQGGPLAITAETENAADSAPPLGEGAEAAPETEEERKNREFWERHREIVRLADGE